MALTYVCLKSFWGGGTANFAAVSTITFTAVEIYLDKYSKGSILLFEAQGNKGSTNHYSSQQGRGKVLNNPNVWMCMCCWVGGPQWVDYTMVMALWPLTDVDPFQRVFLPFWPDYREWQEATGESYRLVIHKPSTDSQCSRLVNQREQTRHTLLRLPWGYENPEARD